MPLKCKTEENLAICSPGRGRCLSTGRGKQRILARKKAVGLLNLTLCANPEFFNDITDGYNLGCNGAPVFYCTEGWDPVTGLGAPNYGKMREVFMALP